MTRQRREIAIIPQQLSYCGVAPASHELFRSWNTDPWLIAALVGLSALLLVASRSRLIASPGAAAAGIGILFIAFVSPLCALTNALFAARTVHHLLLLAAAGPLFALAVPERGRRPGSVVPPLFVCTATLWFWHWPAAYSGALSSVAIYWAMQVSLLASAIWFWWRVLNTSGDPAGALLAVVGAMGQMGLLGAILTFAPTSFYDEHLVAPLGYGLTALEDQQLAGLIMWVPAMLPYFLLGMMVAWRAWPRLRAAA